MAAIPRGLTLKPYYDHAHQFFRLMRVAAGEIIDKEYNGDAVAKDWMGWLHKTSSK